jgi:hypothetical protein
MTAALSSLRAAKRRNHPKKTYHRPHKSHLEELEHP